MVEKGGKIVFRKGEGWWLYKTDIWFHFSSLHSAEKYVLSYCCLFI